MIMNIDDLWKCVGCLDIANAPRVNEDLNPGASLREVEMLESELG